MATKKAASQNKGTAPATNDAGVRLVVYISGVARGTPGPAGAGVVLTTRNGGVLGTLSKYVGRQTNHVADYEALLLALRNALEAGVGDIEVRTGNQLVVGQLTLGWSVNAPELRARVIEAKALLNRFGRWHIEQIPSAQNRAAHRVADEGASDEGGHRVRITPAEDAPVEGGGVAMERADENERHPIPSRDECGGMMVLGDAMTQPTQGHAHRKHVGMTPATLRKLKAAFGKMVWKPFGVGTVYGEDSTEAAIERTERFLEMRKKLEAETLEETSPDELRAYRVLIRLIEHAQDPKDDHPIWSEARQALQEATSVLLPHGVDEDGWILGSASRDQAVKIPWPKSEGKGALHVTIDPDLEPRFKMLVLGYVRLQRYVNDLVDVSGPPGVKEAFGQVMKVLLGFNEFCAFYFFTDAVCALAWHMRNLYEQVPLFPPDIAQDCQRYSITLILNLLPGEYDDKDVDALIISAHNLRAAGIRKSKGDAELQSREAVARFLTKRLRKATGSEEGFSASTIYNWSRGARVFVGNFRWAYTTGVFYEGSALPESEIQERKARRKGPRQTKAVAQQKKAVPTKPEQPLVPAIDPVAGMSKPMPTLWSDRQAESDYKPKRTWLG